MNATTGLNTDYSDSQFIHSGKIESLSVKKLFGRYSYDLKFQEGVNILIGSNGVGKTTLLKLMWYMISGNLRQALKEVPFEEAIVKAGKGVTIELRKRVPGTEDKRRDGSAIVHSLVCDAVITEAGDRVIFSRLGIPLEELDSDLQAHAPYLGTPSLMMPVFRRPGTGFGVDSDKIDQAYQEVRNAFNRWPHVMLISASVNDLALEYSLISQQESQARLVLQAEKDKEIRKLLTSAEIKKIENTINKYDEHLRFINTRSDRLNAYISYLFWDKSISLSAKGINDTGSVLGNPEQRRVSIDQLSSGEESILSLLVYNAARNDSIFVIDEPELYLHPDWQREIIRILKEQNPTNPNQFCIATHSPAIAASLHSGVIDLDAELRKQGFEI